MSTVRPELDPLSITTLNSSKLPTDPATTRATTRWSRDVGDVVLLEEALQRLGVDLALDLLALELLVLLASASFSVLEVAVVEDAAPGVGDRLEDPLGAVTQRVQRTTQPPLHGGERTEKLRKSSVSKVTVDSTSSISRERAWPRERAGHDERLSLARGEQCVLQRVELLERLPRAERDGVERIGRDVHRHAGLVLESTIDAREDAPPPASMMPRSMTSAASSGGLCRGSLTASQIRRRRVRRWLLDLVRGDRDGLRQPGDEVAARGSRP